MGEINVLGRLLFNLKRPDEICLYDDQITGGNRRIENTCSLVALRLLQPTGFRKHVNLLSSMSNFTVLIIINMLINVVHEMQFSSLTP